MIQLYPFSKLGKYMYFHGSRKKKQIAITFDDGPSEQTSKILNILKKHNVKGTFFILGEKAKKYKKSISQIIKQGSEIGNHTYNHTDCIFISKSKIKNTILKTDNELGINTKLFRPPHMKFGLNLFSVLKKLKKKAIICDVEPRDWSMPGSQVVISRILKTVKNGSIIGLHDCMHRRETNTDLIEILNKVIPILKRKYNLVTVSELLKNSY